jgi:hypothetical protein
MTGTHIHGNVFWELKEIGRRKVESFSIKERKEDKDLA